MAKATQVPVKQAEDERPSATPPEKPSKVSSKIIRLLKLTERGARRRSAKAKKGIKDVDAKLDKKGLGAARRAILLQERQDFQDDLARAERDRIQMGRQLTEAVNNNRRLKRPDMQKSKRALRAVRTIKALKGRTTKLVSQNEVRNGAADVKRLEGLSKAGDGKAFRVAADAFIEGRDAKLFLLVTSDSDVHSSVLQHLMSFLARTGKEVGGENVVAATARR